MKVSFSKLRPIISSSHPITASSLSTPLSSHSDEQPPLVLVGEHSGAALAVALAWQVPIIILIIDDVDDDDHADDDHDDALADW